MPLALRSQRSKRRERYQKRERENLAMGLVSYESSDPNGDNKQENSCSTSLEQSLGGQRSPQETLPSDSNGMSVRSSGTMVDSAVTQPSESLNNLSIREEAMIDSSDRAWGQRVAPLGSLETSSIDEGALPFASHSSEICVEVYGGSRGRAQPRGLEHVIVGTTRETDGSVVARPSESTPQTEHQGEAIINIRFGAKRHKVVPVCSLKAVIAPTRDARGERAKDRKSCSSEISSQDSRPSDLRESDSSEMQRVIRRGVDGASEIPSQELRPSDLRESDSSEMQRIFCRGSQSSN
jgi:hypothetical protein